MALGGALALDVRLAGIATAVALAPVLVWSPPSLLLGLLAVGLGVNVDLVTAPVSVSLPQLIGLSLIAASLLRPGRGRGGERFARRGCWAIGGLLVLAGSSLSLIGAVSPAGAASGLLQLAVVATVMAVVSRELARTAVPVDSVLRLLLLGAAISLVVAAVQVILNVGPASYRTGGVMRAFSTYGQPNSYGLYLVGMVPLALVARSGGRASWALLVSLLAGVVLTGSRGAWIATAAGLAVYGILRASPKPSTVLKGLAVLALIPLAVALLPRDFLAARVTLMDWSTQQRLLVLLVAWRGIVQSPITGYGAGSFGELLGKMAPSQLEDDVTMPHNLILEIWFELGLAAVLAFVTLMILYYGVAVRAYRRGRDIRIAAVVAAVTAMLVGSMFGSLFIRGVQETFVVLIALTGALVAARHRSHSTREEPRAHPASL